MHLIPKEMKELRQWILFRVEEVDGKFKKIPVVSGTENRLASCIDPLDWCKFSELKPTEYAPYIGFCLTELDPFVCIDIDNMHKTEHKNFHENIVKFFNTYIERSISQNGMHIFCKGKFSKQITYKDISVYFKKRFILITGDMVKELPVNDETYVLEQLEEEILTKNKNTGYTHKPKKLNLLDKEVYEIAHSLYGEKFLSLLDGKVGVGYESQSEADMSLMSMLCECSDLDSQVARIFRESGLGKRKKADRDNYIFSTILKIRNNNEIAYNKQFVEVKKAPLLEIEKSKSNNEFMSELPNGIIKDIADFIYETSVRPVREVAVAAALASFAGCVGRQYNVSQTGLNLYLLILAPTGTGKEGASSGIDKLFAYMFNKVPNIIDFQGSKSYASGPALIKALSKNPCVFSLLGEFGYTFQALADAKTGGPLLSLKQSLLDVYQKSGYYSVMKSTSYADDNKNVVSVRAPCLTILGESTPETFYDGVTEAVVTDGLLPRFSIIEYKGLRPKRNKDTLNVIPSERLLTNFSNVINKVFTLIGSDSFINVMIDEDALELLDEFDSYVDEQINTKGISESLRHMWNRAHLKSLKISALLAVSIDWECPVILKEHAEWAIKFAKNDVSIFLFKYSSGYIGEENKFVDEIKEIVIDFLNASSLQRRKWGVPFVLTEGNVIPQTFLTRRLRSKKSFANSKLGLSKAVEVALSEAVRDDVLQAILPAEMLLNYNLKVVGYTMGTNFL